MRCKGEYWLEQRGQHGVHAQEPFIVAHKIVSLKVQHQVEVPCSEADGEGFGRCGLASYKKLPIASTGYLLGNISL